MSIKHIVFTTEEKYEGITKDGETLYLTPLPEIPEPTEYTAGNGININASNEISIDSSVVPSKQEVNDKYTKPQSGIPASDLAEAYYLASNPSGFITKSIADLLNYYTKSQTYTKTEVDTLIGAIPTISYQIVASLPTPSAGVSFNVTKVIYMVKDGTVFNEYICIVEGSVYKWEQLGNTTIDMSDYYKKTETYSKSEIDGITDNIGDAINDLDRTKADSEEIPTSTSDLTNDGSDGEHPYLTQHQDISGKLDKQTPSSSSVYAALDNGNQVMRPYTSSDTINTLMWRDTSGRSKVKNPSAALDIANKQYVDSHHDSTKQNVISDIDDIRSQASIAMPKSGGTFTGEVDFSNKNSWLKAYNMAFKNASTTLSATYPNTSISQQGDNLNIDARDGNNNLVYTVIAINTATKVADFKARPTFNGSSIALVSEIPTSADQLNAMSKSGGTFTGAVDTSYGEIKSFKCSHKGYTNNADWYFPVAKLPIDNSGNYASAIVNGRIGGWTANDMSQFSALAWQRGNYTGTQGAVKGWIIPANTKDSALNIADLVIYYQSDLSAILYVKCHGYYTFDFEVSLYQSSCEKLFNGNYVTTPSGTLSPNGTFKNNAENLKGVAHTSDIPTFTLSGTTLTIS